MTNWNDEREVFLNDLRNECARLRELVVFYKNEVTERDEIIVQWITMVEGFLFKSDEKESA
tara:strand:+ start:190 stop:372 length:183 start_codon:yes stop_codon:yes gene_type:complete